MCDARVIEAAKALRLATAAAQVADDAYSAVDAAAATCGCWRMVSGEVRSCARCDLALGALGLSEAADGVRNNALDALCLAIDALADE